MQRLPVESSDIVSVGYEPAAKILEVEFRGGRVYQYRDVEPGIHVQFMRADSYGTFFFAHINGRYRYEKVNSDTDGFRGTETLALVSAGRADVHAAQVACEPYGIDIEPLELPIDEIQADDAEAIAVKKAKQAYRLARQPVVVATSFWNILALHGFPGAYADAVNRWLTSQEVLKLMEGKADRAVCLTQTIAYYDGKRSKVFQQDFWGALGLEARGQGTPIEQLVTMNGQDQTLAESSQESLTTWTAPQENPWQDFAKWLRLQRRLRKV